MGNSSSINYCLPPSLNDTSDPLTSSPHQPPATCLKCQTQIRHEIETVWQSQSQPDGSDGVKPKKNKSKLKSNPNPNPTSTPNPTPKPKQEWMKVLFQEENATNSVPVPTTTTVTTNLSLPNSTKTYKLNKLFQYIVPNYYEIVLQKGELVEVMCQHGGHFVLLDHGKTVVKIQKEWLDEVTKN